MINNASNIPYMKYENCAIRVSKTNGRDKKKSSDLDLDRQEANKRGVKSRHRCGDIVIALRKREKDTHGS